MNVRKGVPPHPENPLYVTALRCGPVLWVAWWENFHHRAHARFGFTEEQARRRCTAAVLAEQEYS